MYISHTKSFNIPVSIALATLAHMINVYEICLNTTNYPIFNMQDFRYCLFTSILDCFGQLVHPPCKCVLQYIYRSIGSGLLVVTSLRAQNMYVHKTISTTKIVRPQMITLRSCLQKYPHIYIWYPVTEQIEDHFRIHSRTTLEMMKLIWQLVETN